MRSDIATRLLLVEGDQANQSSMHADLSAFLGAQTAIDACATGRDAAKLLRENHFDVILADLESICDLAPDAEHGMAKLAKLAGGSLIIALSCADSVSSAVSAMRAGAHDYVHKPIDCAAFVTRVEELAQRHGRSAAKPPCTSANSNRSDLRNPMRVSEISSAVAAATPEILPMWRQEQRIIEDAIARFGGNVAQAAAALEISPSTIYRKKQSWEEATPLVAGAA